MHPFLPSALLALAALLSPASAQISTAPEYLRIRVEAEPGSQVILCFGPELASPLALPGFSGLLVLDPRTMVCLPGSPVDMQGVSVSMIPVGAWPSAWSRLYFQAGILSPRDPASGQLRLPVRAR